MPKTFVNQLTSDKVWLAYKLYHHEKKSSI
jgi:hypothetical protein